MVFFRKRGRDPTVKVAGTVKKLPDEDTCRGTSEGATEDCPSSSTLVSVGTVFCRRFCILDASF